MNEFDETEIEETSEDEDEQPMAMPEAEAERDALAFVESGDRYGDGTFPSELTCRVRKGSQDEVATYRLISVERS